VSSKLVSKKTQRLVVSAQVRKPSILVLVMILFVCFLTLPACTSNVPALASKPVETVTQALVTQAPVLETPVFSQTPSKAADIKTQEPAVNPLTGLAPDAPELLDRRPIIIKIENLPRNNRPQFGLNLADIVYEYHTEEGTTRFAAIFYGKHAEKVGPVRSARWFDVQLIHMYKSIFIYGSAYQKLYDYLFDQDFSERLILEGPYTYPALYRYEPAARNLLLVNTHLVNDVINAYKINNDRQDLSGMSFTDEINQGGDPAVNIYLRFSGAIYNRWDYDTQQGVYLRFVDSQDDINGTSEVYKQHVDGMSGEPITTDNLVMLFSEYKEIDGPTITSPDLLGTGKAYVARNGFLLEAKWVRDNEDDIVKLVDNNGQPVNLKPGRTWYEILNTGSKVTVQAGGAWRFVFYMPK